VSGFGTRVLVLDNRDSFVFNLVDELRRGGAEVLTIRSNISLEDLQKRLARFEPHLVVLSPGPGRPEEAGIMVPWLRSEPVVPVLGICLGHQAIAVAAGGRVDIAPRLVHGRSSPIQFRPDPLFQGLTGPFVAGRYHSLVVTEVPETMDVIATTEADGHELVMGVRHRHLCQVGMQFHPESILTVRGGRLLSNFVEEAVAYQKSESGKTGRWSQT
jgi:anthranilate synthase/aminodeoxychorismate synthase-like glutamine amidotransferase